MDEGNFLYISASVSDRGLSEKRPVNEDAYFEDRRLGLFIVADGVGGAQAGDFASQMAIETISEVFSRMPENFDAEEAMAIAIRHANQAIFAAARDVPQLSSMATTVAAVHIAGNIATIGHVGDSRVYRIAPDGTLYRETVDHSVVEEEVRAGRMTAEQALTHPSRNVISRALGAEETVNVDLKTIMVEPGTIFLLCTDGITRHITDEELSRIFNNEIDPDVICDRLREICYSRGAEDNLTAVVVRISTPLAPVFAAGSLDSVSQRDSAEVFSANGGESHREPHAALSGDAADEETVASAKPQQSSLTDSEQLVEETAPATYAEDFSDLREEFSDEPITASADDFGPSRVVVPAQSSEKVDSSSSPLSYTEAATVKSGSGFGSLLLSFFLVLIGAAAGALTYHFVVPQQITEVPRLVEMKSGNIPLTEFEEARREVDRAPDRYLAANAASPENAEDHYLLGRALLLTGKYVEAKKQFLLAKQMLPEAVETNSKTLETDIAIGLTLADSPEAVANLKKQLEAPQQDANVNSSVTNGKPTLR
jgi:protein phosphatase